MTQAKIRLLISRDHVTNGYRSMADSLDSSINEENLCLLEPQPTVHDVEIAPKKCDVSQRYRSVYSFDSALLL